MKIKQDTVHEPLRAVVYLRFATVGYAARNRLAAVRQACEQRAKELGAVIVTEYLDVDLEWPDPRKQLERMLADLVDTTDIEYVIAPDHSTIARSMPAYARVVWRIEETGVQLIVASVPLEAYEVAPANPLWLMHAHTNWANNETQNDLSSKEVGDPRSISTAEEKQDD